MTERYKRLEKTLSQRLSHEQLCQRRTAVCQGWLQAVERRLARLQAADAQVRGGRGGPGQATKIHWHQDEQRYLQALQSRLERTQRLGQRLGLRLEARETEVVKAAQHRRATQTALGRIEEGVRQTAVRNSRKSFDELVRLRALAER